MSIVKLSTPTTAYQANDQQAGAGQLRNGFRNLLQSIQDGNLQAAKSAYQGITQTFPDFFNTLSDKLTFDYKAIGNALSKSNMAEARQAVIRLQQDLQSIGRMNTLSRPDQKPDVTRVRASTAGIISGGYGENGDIAAIGTNIDIII